MKLKNTFDQSIDLCIGHMDRVAVVDGKTGKENHRLSVQKTRRLMK